MGGDLASSLNMAEVSGHSWSGYDIVEGQLGDKGALLEQERERLTNATSSTHHSYLGGGLRGRERGRRERERKRDMERVKI